MQESLEDLNRRYADAMLPLTILFGLFTVCGVLGNILVLIVFSLGRAYRRNNFRVFVIFLAIIDLVCCLLILPSEIAKHRSYFNFTNVGLCKAKVFINMWGAVACALALLVVSIDRFRKVCCPLKRQISQRLALQLCAAVTFGISVVIAAPATVTFGIVSENKTNIFNTTTEVFVCTITSTFKNHPLTMIFQLASLAILAGVSVSTVVMYILIGRQIYLHWGTFAGSFRTDSGKESHSDFTSDQGLTQQKHPVASPTSRSTETASTSNNDNTETQDEQEKIKMLSNQKTHSSIDRSLSGSVSSRSTLKRLFTMSSFSSSTRRDDSRRTTFGRQGSRLGVRRFPYKTLIWFVLTLIFIATNWLSIVMAFLNPHSINKDPKEYVVFSVFYRLLYINNCINPIVYALLDKHFRSVCRNIGPRLKARFRGA